MKYEQEIKTYALKNALDYGKADPSKILPKLFQHGLKKEEIKEIFPKLNEIVNKINSLSKEEQEKQFEPLKSLIPEKQKKEKNSARTKSRQGEKSSDEV